MLIFTKKIRHVYIEPKKKDRSIRTHWDINFLNTYKSAHICVSVFPFLSIFDLLMPPGFSNIFAISMFTFMHLVKIFVTWKRKELVADIFQ